MFAPFARLPQFRGNLLQLLDPQAEASRLYDQWVCRELLMGMLSVPRRFYAGLVGDVQDHGTFPYVS